MMPNAIPLFILSGIVVAFGALTILAEMIAPTFVVLTGILAATIGAMLIWMVVFT